MIDQRDQEGSGTHSQFVDHEHALVVENGKEMLTRDWMPGQPLVHLSVPSPFTQEAF